MRKTISDCQGAERLRTGLTAGAATVGRPTGVAGKKHGPRRSRVTEKEKAALNKKAGLAAGGPGSGRKPGFKSAENTDKLEKMHQSMTKAGFKFHHSSGDNKGTITHVYRKADAASVGGRQSASIFERSNGDHQSNLK